MREKEYTCWYEGQTEDDAKVLKAPNAEASAKKAVDIWRHEKYEELGDRSVNVNVKEFSGEKAYKVVVSGEGSSPQATL